MVNMKLQPTKSASSIGAKIMLDTRNGVVEEKPTKPPGVPKFHRRTAPSQTTNPILGSLEDAMDNTSNAASICQQMLIQGYVQSYVDFYHLTHKLEHYNRSIDDELDAATTSAVPTSAVPTAIMINIAQDDLLLLRDNLLQAEIARRQGDTANVYSAYIKLADYYVAHKDWKTSFFFHEKCLEVAQLTNDIRAEMAANHALGSINQMMASYDRARVHHERHEQLAESVDIFDEIARANAELYKVYIIIAEQKETAHLLDEALELYHLSLEAAKKSWDKSAEAEANGRIGAVLLHRGETQTAIPFLKQQSQLAADLGHAESRCRACTSLALAWDTLGQPDKALTELTLVNSISEQSGDVFLQSQACKALGTMYSKMGKLDQAVEVLQRHFSLLKSILSQRAKAKDTATNAKAPVPPAHKVTAMDLDLARTYIGISKGNQMLGSYVMALQFDLVSLLDWKLNRTEIKVNRSADGPVTAKSSSANEATADDVEDDNASSSQAE